MRSFRMDEISGVDDPAQVGAVAVIMKRNGTPTEEIAKRAWLTDSVDGHAHLLDDVSYEGRLRYAGETSWSVAESDKDNRGHSHPWVMNADGSVTIGMADGHSHVILETSKRSFSARRRQELADSGAAMPDGSFPIENKADLGNAVKAFGRAKDKAAAARHIAARAEALGATEELPTEGDLAEALGRSKKAKKRGDYEMTIEEKLAKAEADLAKANEAVAKAEAAAARSTAIAALNDVEKVHFNGLSDEAKTAFLAKSADGRKAEVDAVSKAAADSDPVVYKTRKGTEIRKSAGETLLAIAKDADEQAKLNEDLAKKNAENDLRKRAGELLPNLPGAIDTRMEILRSVDSIQDVEKRKAAMESLSAQNAAMAGVTKTIGSAGGASGADRDDAPTAKLDKLAKKHSEDNKVTYAKAYDAVLKTKEGAELYAASVQ